MIFPIWQPFGASSHQLAQSCGALLGEAATHTGTLDPMAEGVLVILTGEDRYAKGSLGDWKKTYDFSILWGVATDSQDRLGLITQVDARKPNLDEIRTVINEFPHSYNQIIPQFSARRWNGKSSFDWAREETQLPTKTRAIEIGKIILRSSFALSQTKVLSDHNAAITDVLGNFRQDNILKNWNDSLTSDTGEFLITEHSATVSTGTYIRQLVQDIAAKVGAPATTYSITRLSNGPFELEDCIELDELGELKKI